MMFDSASVANPFLVEVAAGANEWKPPAGVILRNPGGVAGGAAPATPGQAEELGGQAG